MKILNMVSKSFICPSITLKIFWSEISMLVEISTDFDLLSIIEFQIYSFILPILQVNLGKILAKMFSNCVISRNFGTADTHEYHLERLVKKCLIDRGYNEIIDEGDIVGKYPEQQCLLYDKKRSGLSKEFSKRSGLSPFSDNSEIF